MCALSLSHYSKTHIFVWSTVLSQCSQQSFSFCFSLKIRQLIWHLIHKLFGPGVACIQTMQRAGYCAPDEVAGGALLSRRLSMFSKSSFRICQYFWTGSLGREAEGVPYWRSSLESGTVCSPSLPWVYSGSKIQWQVFCFSSWSYLGCTVISLQHKTVKYDI